MPDFEHGESLHTNSVQSHTPMTLFVVLPHIVHTMTATADFPESWLEIEDTDQYVRLAERCSNFLFFHGRLAAPMGSMGIYLAFAGGHEIYYRLKCADCRYEKVGPQAFGHSSVLLWPISHVGQEGYL